MLLGLMVLRFGSGLQQVALLIDNSSFRGCNNSLHDFDHLLLVTTYGDLVETVLGIIRIVTYFPTEG